MKSNHNFILCRFLSIAMAASLVLLFGCSQESQTSKDAASHSAVETSSMEHAEHGNDEHGHGKEEHHEDGDADEHSGHEGHDAHEEDGHVDEHSGHEVHDAHEEEEKIVKLNSADMKEFGIEVQTAVPGRLEQYIELPGEIVLNADRLAHVPPRLSGIVRQVFKSLGDQVKTGEVLAVIESRQLADAKAEFLASRERLALARENFEREKKLRQKKISAEKEYLQARNILAEARITKNTAEQKLHALGFSDALFENMPQHPDATFTYYEIRAPFAGTIIEKHITLGESLKEDSESFTIADLSTVWVDINVYQKDLSRVQKGQTVVIEVGHGVPAVTAKIAWIGPLVGEATRTAKARVVLANPDGDLRPGQFVNASVAVADIPVGVRIPKTALQKVEDRTVVFVQTEEGFEPHPVEIGMKSAAYVEIVSGLRVGQSYVVKGAFTLKAQLSKGAFGDGHNH